MYDFSRLHIFPCRFKFITFVLFPSCLFSIVIMLMVLRLNQPPSFTRRFSHTTYPQVQMSQDLCAASRTSFSSSTAPEVWATPIGASSRISSRTSRTCCTFRTKRTKWLSSPMATTRISILGSLSKKIERIYPVAVPLWLISHIRNNGHHSNLSPLNGLKGTITGYNQ